MSGPAGFSKLQNSKMKKILNIVLPLFGKIKLLRYIALGILAGALNFLFINSVTGYIDLLINRPPAAISTYYLIRFIAIIILIVITRRWLSLGIISSSQVLFWKLRKDMLGSILDSDYQQLTSKKTSISTAMLRDVYILTEASMSIIMFCTSLVLAVACLIYLASISLILFGITLVVALLGIGVYQLNSSKNNLLFERGRVLENKFLDYFNSIINGFKEINMDRQKGNDIYDNKLEPLSEDALKTNISAHAGFLSNQITGQVLFYILITSILVVLSILLRVNVSSVVSFVFTLLYLLSSIETIMGSLPILIRAKVSAMHLIDLKTELETERANNRLPAHYIHKDEFSTLSVKALEFRYKGQVEAFGIGPVNLDINKGDVIFIYGGNGSGKTTFIHTLTGIRIPVNGTIYLNDEAVTSANYPEYKTIFSVVFSDFYLFNELLGLKQFDAEKWQRYLHLFELENKVKIENNAFSTTDLSTGQRKRLALIVALMEEKPILVIDEWAADQDPYFRKKFYTEIIPCLKEEGVTIIAITHDDRYYQCADKLFKMDYGKLVQEDLSIYSLQS